MFECPACGDTVQGTEDLLICEGCFLEASKIRAVRDQLAALPQDARLYDTLEKIAGTTGRNGRTATNIVNLARSVISERNTEKGREKTGVDLIAAERQRRIDVEGLTPERDAVHVHGELAQAACAYAGYTTASSRTGNAMNIGVAWWPDNWEWEDFKPKDKIVNLVMAGALIASEIDRLQRRRRLNPNDPNVW